MLIGTPGKKPGESRWSLSTGYFVLPGNGAPWRMDKEKPGWIAIRPTAIKK
jgi:hypothetical protein